jgi:nucleoside-diphosphate-sugar epimerase
VVMFTALVTGKTGFLGKMLAAHSVNYQLFGIGRGGNNEVIADLSVEVPDLAVGGITRIDRVVHAAGLAHGIGRNKFRPEDYFRVNVEGTKNLLRGIERWVSLDGEREYPKQLVYISSVSVYGLEEGVMVKESQALAATESYGKSKVEAEQVVLDWGRRLGVNVLILRLPLIWGENAPGNLGAMESAIARGYYFRFNGDRARKSMVCGVQLSTWLDGLDLSAHGIYNITDGYHPVFSEVEDYFAKKYGKKIRTLPKVMVRMAALVGDLIPGFPINSKRLLKMKSELTFDDSGARKEIGWLGTNVLG